MLSNVRFLRLVCGLATATAGWAAPARGQVLLTFDAPVAGTIQAADGQGTGLTARLPGTGSGLPANSPNLLLDTAGGRLRLRSTDSDLNGQVRLATAEFLGTRLADLGFTGEQNFTVTATFRDVAYNESFDQFGLYVGTSSAQAFRGGYLSFGQRSLFAVNTTNGSDTGLVTSTALAPLAGDDIVLTLSRAAGVYGLAVQNLTDPARSGALPVSPPTQLNGATDLYVGLYGDFIGNTTAEFAFIDSYSVAVTPVPEPTGLVVATAAVVGLVVRRRRPVAA